MKKYAITSFVVDAFTHHAFGGNPAAVCILKETLADQQLQKIAAEFNLSETAFLLHLSNNRWQLRWFTPTCEINLCGHATLAAAYVLANELHLKHEEFIFSTRSGDLMASAQGDVITLNFPKIIPQALQTVPPAINQLALKSSAVYQAGEDIIIEVASEAEVLAYIPDIEKIMQVETRGIILCAASDNNERDFVSRFFAPRAGINEDPVTGSAQCSLAVLWSQKLNKTHLRAEQLSARRGHLMLRVLESRVLLIGQCVIVMRGALEW